MLRCVRMRQSGISRRGLNHKPKPCSVCGATAYRRRRCPQHYRELAREEAKKLLKPVIRKSCSVCTRIFLTNRSHKQYCSTRCSAVARSERDFPFLREDVVCPCGKPFPRRKKSDKFCSRACKWRYAKRVPGYVAPERNAARIVATCKQCRNEFTQLRRHYIKRIGQRNPQFCSMPCCYESRRGAKSRFYRGGTIWNRGKTWAYESEAARIRDGFQCVICNADPKSEVKPPVDHIIPFRLMVKWLLPPNVLENLATLCQRCHTKKTVAEIKLLRGDVIGFNRRLVQIGYPADRVATALRLVGLSEKGLELGLVGKWQKVGA